MHGFELGCGTPTTSPWAKRRRRDAPDWIFVRDGEQTFYLNADTKREGVAKYLALVDTQGDALTWTVVLSRMGGMSAFAYGETRIQIPSFYLYKQ